MELCIEIKEPTLNVVLESLRNSKLRNEQAKKVAGIELFPGIDEALEMVERIAAHAEIVREMNKTNDVEG